MADIPFGPFSFDTSAPRLLRDAAEVKLRPQALHALKVLLLHNGQWVGYEQMIAEAWLGTVVSRHTVDVTVGEVRRTLHEYGSWIENRPKIGYRLEVPKSDELVRKGWHFWSRRTREGFERAIDCFERAGAECPSDFRAFEGLSVSNLMLATFGMRPPLDTYPGFLAAHARAIELGGVTPELRCNRAHGMHMFERRYADAEGEFLRVIDEKPSLASTYVRSAMLCATLNRLDEALEYVARAYQTDALLPTAPTTEVAVRFWRREFDEAIAVGARAVDLHPYLQIGRAIFARSLEHVGRLDEALAQYQTATVMSPDLPWLRALEGSCRVKQGRAAEAGTILDALQALRQTEYVDAYFMAIFRASLGHRDEAFAELERAWDEHSAWLYSMDVDPEMDYFRGDKRYERLRDELRTRSTAFVS